MSESRCEDADVSGSGHVDDCGSFSTFISNRGRKCREFEQSVCSSPPGITSARNLEILTLRSTNNVIYQRG
ncbi:hypothetical protein L596_025421 [Steinernema carpocapsae]|uniref:Uncharacterized protein n=1 Tax=Steinernema carpocapsae TaxID=34508 RepID=A0A4U5M7W8_STECR|nr:hypothetical protein L596_025421 [Steinernema carpocapsae]